MPQVKKAKVFMSGKHQALRIPAEYRFASNEVYIRRDPRSGDIILSENPPKESWKRIFAALDEAGCADFDLDRDTSPPQKREWFET